MIYCVEDDQSIRELIIYALKSDGYDAVGFGEGKSFFKSLESALPYLIVLDIMLPGEDGMDILKKLKVSPRTRNIPVIMLTAKSSEYDKVTFKEFELLKYLLENAGIVLTRDKLLEEVWGYDYEGETRTVDVHIRTLRKKLRDAGPIIETVRGVGYRIGDRA